MKSIYNIITLNHVAEVVMAIDQINNNLRDYETLDYAKRTFTMRFIDDMLYFSAAFELRVKFGRALK